MPPARAWEARTVEADTFRVAQVVGVAGVALAITGCSGRTDPATEVGAHSVRLNAFGTADNGSAYSALRYQRTEYEAYGRDWDSRRRPATEEAGASASFSGTVSRLSPVTGPLLAIDAPSLLYRAFFALPESITAADGTPVNAVLGSVNLILQEVNERAPRAVVLCFGPDAATYRVERYAGYHADRPPVPDGLAGQWGLAREVYGALGWHLADTDELEADDLLGAHALAEEERDGTALVLTGDRDLYQCASERTTVLYVRTGRSGAEPVGPAEVRERYGVEPAQVPDFIALRGDPSDGLPGAKGIGAKTAAELLARHATLEALLEAVRRPLPAERPRIVDALLADPEALLAFKEIATLQPVDVEPPPDRPTDREAGAAAVRALGMERLAGRLAP